MRTYACICTYVHTSIYMYICIYVCMDIDLYVNTHTRCIIAGLAPLSSVTPLYVLCLRILLGRPVAKLMQCPDVPLFVRWTRLQFTRQLDSGCSGPPDGGSMYTLRVQGPNYKVSTQNHNYDSKYRNPKYPIVSYFGPLGICYCARFWGLGFAP